MRKISLIGGKVFSEKNEQIVFFSQECKKDELLIRLNNLYSLKSIKIKN